ncbi:MULTISPECIES: N-acetyl-1-D-myo-inositol-2-amino-2-deoxy-alpha-D-glucopyranoside deacetylase [Tsukamurella]|uniref:1D-myo-inositol 2-acetamido-2-deoxy-alpha-D-glucopyranoside deacetylase n=2 Tax=Tsukamurella TaxID=2060 RepID=A0A5C5S2K9_9ACTN|nr:MULTISPECIES: N-acetyl-1-D-myo-inositol-2-amino-2-deoxy-alpha-D-glucopyranoside deacetylase [Tsukamurella]NMD56505.1 N-acetyl-1-D-myo-inositol-2-amino-2-deoxy-alpha-D-glucopyranoside deacetylase [Tsukamurella columbiensis]TWS29152.1 N-acetyl-1-D-myo-inositol-2-amino-2-deoxy-alpha-D-glucopyranoside deacetylase [Tsukamurella conjunctivitidis]
MTRTSGRRLLLVHAHPDDETITTGGTIARYLAEGAEVTVVTCTLGEEGEVMEPRFAQLTADNADQLGGYRIGELTAALAALSDPAGPVLRPRFLGGMGRWRDSGMAGTPAAEHPRAFASSPRTQVDGGPLQALTRIVREVRPQVVITYDEVGGYGHPDHIAAHLLTHAAVDAAADPAVAGEPWTVEKLYWTVTSRGDLDAGLAALRGTDLPGDWRVPAPDELPAHDDHGVTARIDVAPVLDRKRAALRAHATQLGVSADGAALALTNRIAQPVFAEEAYVLARGAAAPDPDGLERDLFAGVA